MSDQPSSLEPELALVGLAGHEALPGVVGLLNDLQGHLLVQRLLVEAEGIDGLVVGGLVPAEPLADAADDARALRLDVADVVQLGRELVVLADRDDLPVELAVVDHREDAEDLHGLDGALGQRRRADLDHVQRVVVAGALRLRVHDVGVLPGLREHAVVPEDRAVVVTKLALLDVLRNGVAALLRGHLHLRLGHLRDLDDAVEDARLARLERDVVPRRDVLAAGILELEAVLRGAHLADNLRGVRGEEAGLREEAGSRGPQGSDEARGTPARGRNCEGTDCHSEK
mmetsp:Transcript_58851/g.127742  ORF Transcript_58851/g.127742 Transcript_58851/m.127742 type:complete len:285 (+) Transcript_58851:280-1134(+)